MHGVRSAREARGWSQADLARTSGVRRATISGIETERVVPSVQIALQLAEALELTVESLFVNDARQLTWARLPPEGPTRYWAAEVAGVALAYPVEPSAVPHPHDGVGQPWADLPIPPSQNLHTTLVLASCDPTAALLARALADRGIRLICLNRPSGAALDLLRQGLVHAAGVHFATPKTPDANRAAEQTLRWLPGGEWEIGVVVSQDLRKRALMDLVRQDLRWVNRPQGSGARASLDRLLGAHRGDRGPPMGYEHEARDHVAVAEVVAAGFAQAGVAVRMVAQERGLGFRSIETAFYEIAVAPSMSHDPRILALSEVLSSKAYLRSLGEVPGMSPLRAGAS